VRRVRLGLVLVVVAGVWGVVSAAPAMAASPPGTVTNYTDPSIKVPYEITAGPDGALWFTNNGNNSIGRITTDGTVTSYSNPSIGQPEGIAAGPDGALWFTNVEDPYTGVGNNSIGRITTSGMVTNHTDPSIQEPSAIAAGSDGALWFTNYGNSSIRRITTSGIVTDYGVSNVDGMAAGPDGALWFTSYGNSIGRITTSGIITTFTGSGISFPYGIAAGPDGALWFTNRGNGSIGRITTTGIVTNFTGPGISDPFGIAAGSDGARWFTNYGSNSIGRIQAGGPVIVSELRLTGPSTRPGDQYIDLYNGSGVPVSLGGWTLHWTSSGLSGSAALRNTMLPAGGHYLLAGSWFSLSDVSPPDQTVALPASLSGVRLIEPDGSVVSDSVGYVGSGDVWGTGLTAPVYPAGNDSLVAFGRRCARGAPIDAGDNRADFVLVAPDAMSWTSGSPVLGTASPLDLGSPGQVNGVAQSSLLYPAEGESGSGNLAYAPPSGGSVSDSNPGRLVFYQTIRNVSDQSATPETITRLQIRVTGLSTYGEGAIADPGDPAGAAVLSDVSSSDQTVTGPTDCPGDDQVVGTSLAGTGDGGLNSVLSVALPAGGLAPGACLNVAIAFAVDQTGPFALAYNVEDDLKPSVPTATAGTTAPATATTGAGTPVPAAAASAPPALAGTVTPTGVTATSTPTPPGTTTTIPTTATTTHAKQAIHHARARHAKHHHQHRARHATTRRRATPTLTTRSSHR
jgi:streptogramin lyase